MSQQYTADPLFTELRTRAFGFEPHVEQRQSAVRGRPNGVRSRTNGVRLNDNRKEHVINVGALRRAAKSYDEGHGEDDENDQGGDGCLGKYDFVGRYKKDIARIPRLAPTEEAELARRARKGDEKARERMIVANLHLVLRRAWTYRGLGVSFLDLVCEGNIGLMKSVDRFNPDKGRLTTYAPYRIKDSIFRALSRQSRRTRVSIEEIRLMSRANKVETSLRMKSDSPPTDEEIAAALGVEVEKLREARSAIYQQYVALDSPVGDDGDSTVGEFVPDEQAPDPFEVTSQKSESDYLNALLPKLQEDERRVLRLRFGLDNNGECLTLEDVGEMFGLSRQRIKQIQDLALVKLNSWMTGVVNNRARKNRGTMKKGH